MKEYKDISIQDIENVKGYLKKCDRQYLELMGYTKKEMYEVADTLNLPYSKCVDKEELCQTITRELSFVELKKRFEAIYSACKKTLESYQSTSFLKGIGPKKTEKLLPVVVQQILWLMDRHDEFYDILNMNPEETIPGKNVSARSAKLIMLVATVEGQCKQADSIFKGMVEQVEEPTSYFSFWS